jgi:hypothetical protein
MSALADVVQAAAAELIGRFPGADAPTRRDLEGIACLATALEATRQTIHAKGCSQELAALFAAMRARLGHDLKRLADAGRDTMASGALINANATMKTMLALMPPAGSA